MRVLVLILCVAFTVAAMVPLLSGCGGGKGKQPQVEAQTAPAGTPTAPPSGKSPQAISPGGGPQGGAMPMPKGKTSK